MMESRPEVVENQDANVARLTASLHAAQAQGLLNRADVVKQLVLGIVTAVASTVEGNARNPATAPVLQSDVYWNHFEMDIKEALLGAFAWVDPQLYQAVRDAIEVTFRELKKIHRLT